MGNSMGQERILFTETFGRSIQLSADGAPKYKAGGVTLDWSTVPVVGANGTNYQGVVVANGLATFEDGVEVPIGAKAIRYGVPVIRRASDGRYIYGSAAAFTAEAPTRSECYLVNETWLEEDTFSNHPGVIEGGRVFLARIAASDVASRDASATNATGLPTMAAIEAIMTLIVYAQD